MSFGSNLLARSIAAAAAGRGSLGPLSVEMTRTIATSEAVPYDRHAFTHTGVPCRTRVPAAL